MAWAVFVSYAVSPVGSGAIQIHIPFRYAVAGTFAPTVAAVVMQWIAEGNLRASASVLRGHESYLLASARGPLDTPQLPA